MLSARYQDTIMLRLQLGESIHDSLILACRNQDLSGALVASGIGMLADPELAFYVNGGYQTQLFEGKFELLSLLGNISVYGEGLLAHLHVTLARPDYSVFGGHLIRASVGLSVEVALQAIREPVRMYRKLEPEWGLPGLYLDENGA